MMISTQQQHNVVRCCCDDHKCHKNNYHLLSSSLRRRRKKLCCCNSNHCHLRRIKTKTRRKAGRVRRIITTTMMVLLLNTQPISAKIRIPSMFHSIEKKKKKSSNNNNNNNEQQQQQQQQRQHQFEQSTDGLTIFDATNQDAHIDTNNDDITDTIVKNEIGIENDDDDYETIFKNWMYPNNNNNDKNNIKNNISNKKKGTTTSTTSTTTTVDQTNIDNNNNNHNNGILYNDEIHNNNNYDNSFSFLSNQFLLMTEQRMTKKMILIKNQVKRIMNHLILLTYETTNNIVRYKFPVGIVSVYVTIQVLGRLIHKLQRTKKGTEENNSNNNDDCDVDDLDSYQYILRHTGRAFDIDSDDLVSYRYHGGIEQVRARLIRSAFSSSFSGVVPDEYNDNDNDNDNESIINIVERNLIETLNTALAIQFVPGGSHSEYVRKMIPSLSNAEKYANQLGINLDDDDDLHLDHHHHHHHHHRQNTRNTNNKKKNDDDDDEFDSTQCSSNRNSDLSHLMRIGLQTVEVRALDSQLRSIRDRLIRTTYRLNRTVRYWKGKVESLSLSSPSLSSSSTVAAVGNSATTKTSRGRRTVSFISKLNRHLGNFFYSGSSGGSDNSLLEGDRLRLAFATAAYDAEIVRLGKVIRLLNKRPYEMSDSTLTNALVEQQQQQHREEEEDKRLKELSLQEEQALKREEIIIMNDRSAGEIDEVDKKNGITNIPRGRIHRTIIRMRDKVVMRKTTESETEEIINTHKKSYFGAGLLTGLVQPSLWKTSFMSLPIFAAKKKRELNRRARDDDAATANGRGKTKKGTIRNSFFSIRYNAVGRGKFSVQIYDESSVTIGSDTAQKILLRDFENGQRPWLDSASKWTLQARTLIVDVIRETVQASIHPSSSSTIGGGVWSSSSEISSSTHNYFFNEANPNLRSSRNSGNYRKSPVTELADLKSTWQIRQYDDQSSDDNDNANVDHRFVRGTSLLGTRSTLLPSPSSSSSCEESNLQQRQWMFVYEMSRDINRLHRVGEGKSLKFKWKEVHWIHWLRQWDLLGLPSAGLKILAATWVHDKLQPHVPKIKLTVGETYVAVMEILMTRFWTPFKELVYELMSRRRGIMTGVSLSEEEASLDIMLRDLGLGDGTPSTRHEATIKATRQYESNMHTGLMWHALGGRLVRLMLIQMQQLKVSMLDAAERIDALFEANRINLQVLAVVPAVGIMFFSAKLFFRSLFHIRSKNLRPINSVYVDMTDFLIALESNVILRTDRSRDKRSSSHRLGDSNYDSDNNDEIQTTIALPMLEEEKELGEFCLSLYNYLVLLDYASPQPFSSQQCDTIHRSLTAFLGRAGSFTRDHLTVNDQIRLINIVKDNHRDLSKFL